MTQFLPAFLNPLQGRRRKRTMAGWNAHTIYTNLFVLWSELTRVHCAWEALGGARPKGT